MKTSVTFQQHPKLIIFDLDGTLVDSAGDIRYAANRTFVACGHAEQPLEQVVQWIGGGAEIFIQQACDYFNAPEQFDEMFSEFMKHYQQLNHDYSRLYHGVEDFLAWAESQAIKMAIATNKPEALVLPLLKHFSINRVFSKIVGGDSFARRKPDPMPLLKICEHFSVSPEQCWMVGDSTKDAQAAQGAGMPFVGVNYGYQQGNDWLPKQVSSVMIDDLMQLVSRMGYDELVGN